MALIYVPHVPPIPWCSVPLQDECTAVAQHTLLPANHSTIATCPSSPGAMSPTRCPCHHGSRCPGHHHLCATTSVASVLPHPPPPLCHHPPARCLTRCPTRHLTHPPAISHTCLPSH